MRTNAVWLVGWRPYALLGMLCLLLYLPGIASIPPLDRDEARFAQATRQMLETGDFLRIRFQDEARNKKPIGIYWLQSASVTLFGTPASTEAWPYRLPSLLGATLSVLLTFAFGLRLVGRPAALLGAVLLASSLLLVVEAHLAKTDAVLLATVVVPLAIDSSIPWQLVMFIAISDIGFARVSQIFGSCYQAVGRPMGTLRLSVGFATARVMVAFLWVAVARHHDALSWSHYYFAISMLATVVSVWRVRRELGPPHWEVAWHEWRDGFHFALDSFDHWGK